LIAVAALSNARSIVLDDRKVDVSSGGLSSRRFSTYLAVTSLLHADEQSDRELARISGV
jgi:hypothetical protein